MSYKLADGSDSNLYEAGDVFNLKLSSSIELSLVEKVGNGGKFFSPEDGFKVQFEWHEITPAKITQERLNARIASKGVPIQFIWCEGQLHPACDAINIAFTGDSCEQIGAVLYVRGEK